MWITLVFCFVRVTVEVVKLCFAEAHQGPLNTAVVAGNSMSMVCSHNSTQSFIRWNFKSPAMLGESRLFNGSNTLGGFTVNITTNAFSRQVILTKNNTRLEDAGIYKCIIDLPHQMVIRTAQMIVLASEPQFGTNASIEDSGVLEGTILSMWCNINFTGDFTPVMKWSINDGEEFEGIITRRSGQMSHTITRELKAEDNGNIYSCLTYFLPMNLTDALQPGLTRARNAPSYKYPTNFTAIVWFRPRSLLVEPVKHSYNYGNSLRCWGDGDTTVTYRWVFLTTGNVIYGPDMTIPDTLEQNVLHAFECIAYHEKSQTNISKTVNITIKSQSDHGFNKTTLMAILLPIVGIVVALNFGLILQKSRTRRKALKMAGEDKCNVHDNDEVDESVVKPTTTERATVEPTMIRVQEATTTTVDENLHVTVVSQVYGTRPYSSLSIVRPPHNDAAVYSTLGTTGTSTQDMDRARNITTVEAHYVNVPMTEVLDEDPVYMDLADKS